MAFLTRDELHAALESGELGFITGDENHYPVSFNPIDAVQAVSVDLRLGVRFWCLPGVQRDTDGCFLRTATAAKSSVTIQPASKEEADSYLTNFVCTDAITIAPGAFIHGETYERVMMGSSLHAFIEGRSGLARHGLIIHCTAPHIEPQWNRRIRLEIVNHGTVNIELQPGVMRVAQLLVDRIGPPPPRARPGRAKATASRRSGRR